MATHRCRPMHLIKRTVGPWALNAYALVCPDSMESLLIDPGAEPNVLQHMLMGTHPRAIVLTHGHPDHIGALDTMKRKLKVPVLAHRNGTGRGGLIGVDQWVDEGERLMLGKHVVRVIHTPGHTDDQICLDVMASPIILVGDTIFEGGPGHTASVADFRQTIKTLERTVLGWPNETVCYPGHGPSFCLGDRRNAIERFLENEHGDFYGDATWEM